jgi:AraC family transcriptional regulator
MKGKRANQSHFHRSQIGRAQRYIRLHLTEPVSLARLAREAAASPFHFARLFQAHVGETPFEFIRRIRLATALRMLQEDGSASVTEIAMSIGYETSSAFNKALKKALNSSPRNFRKLGKEVQNTLIYDLSQPRQPKEMDVNLTNEFDVVTRPVTHYVYLERRGPFSEVAPPLWSEFSRYLQQLKLDGVSEYLGVSGVDKSRAGEDAMIYQAGVALARKLQKVPDGLQEKSIRSGRYARFLLTGPYTQIWPAFDRVFRVLAEQKVMLRPEYCIENYLNDPQTTAEDQLKTELLVPVE